MKYEPGPVYTNGMSFRARAEAAQRAFRATTLQVGYGTHRGRPWGHFLTDAAAAAGKNFVSERAHRAAIERATKGKGVDLDCTTKNMLSSQAMCFNIFASALEDKSLRRELLRLFVPDLDVVFSIEFEFTPPANLLRDQSGRGGVDHDLLVEFLHKDGRRGLLAIETKFVEGSFSACGFRPGNSETCADDVGVRQDRGACLYSRQRGYAYWERSDELKILHDDAVPPTGCPFGGPHWQLWTNTTLVNALAKLRETDTATFAVCAPADNIELLGQSHFVIATFRSLLAPTTRFQFVAVEDLLDVVTRAGAPWSSALEKRYRLPDRTAALLLAVEELFAAPRTEPFTHEERALLHEAREAYARRPRPAAPAAATPVMESAQPTRVNRAVKDPVLTEMLRDPSSIGRIDEFYRRLLASDDSVLRSTDALTAAERSGKLGLPAIAPIVSREVEWLLPLSLVAEDRIMETAVLLAECRLHGRLTTNTARQLLGRNGKLASNTTTKRRLGELCEMGLFKRRGAERAAFYDFGDRVPVW